MAQIDQIIRLRQGTTEQWENWNPVLDRGEPGVDVWTGEIRVGDGTNYYLDLPISGASDASGIFTYNGWLQDTVLSESDLIDIVVRQEPTGGLGTKPLISDSRRITTRLDFEFQIPSGANETSRELKFDLDLLVSEDLLHPWWGQTALNEDYILDKATPFVGMHPGHDYQSTSEFSGAMVKKIIPYVTPYNSELSEYDEGYYDISRGFDAVFQWSVGDYLVEEDEVFEGLVFRVIYPEGSMSDLNRDISENNDLVEYRTTLEYSYLDLRHALG